MIPDFLKKYEAALKDYERECVRVTATPITDSSLKDELSLTTSKFLGLPFFPKTKDYPVDSEGTPMVLAAQINFEEVPVLEGFPKDGMLQLFLSGDNWYDEEYKVYYHSKNELDQDHLKELYFLTDDLYEDFPIYMVHQLSFEKDIDRGGTEDDQFDFKFGDKGFWEFEEELKENEQEVLRQYFDGAGHKIGGYAEFTQTDPRSYSLESRFDIQLLQIDMDEQIMFEDSGIGHVFIHPDDLAKKDFSKAYFYWDCC